MAYQNDSYHRIAGISKNIKFVVITFIVIVAIGAGYFISQNYFWEEESTNDPNEVVPKCETLIQNLTDAGYDIEQYDLALNCDINANRVVAVKGRHFIDICYDVDKKELENVFGQYEAEYKDSDYFILALNGNYVYCVSDKNIFRKSGFLNTSNVGIQYINE